jgi:NAD(P)-dependent dehydrogenase (short-subunit alcohol dehydrogenase family)
MMSDHKQANSTPYHILITGASRGIGLELVKQFSAAANDNNYLILAAVRNSKKAENLKELAKLHKNIQIIGLNVSEEGSVKDAADLVAKEYKYINLLINNAGIASPNHPNDLALTQTTAEIMLSVYNTNVVGVLLMVKYFHPLLQPYNSNNLAKIINLSSNMGSITNNSFGNSVSYRCSKSAVNMLTKSLKYELNNETIIIIAIHPGWLDTDMGSAGGRSPPHSKQENVTKIIEIIKNLQPNDNGNFMDFNGEIVPY